MAQVASAPGSVIRMRNHAAIGVAKARNNRERGMGRNIDWSGNVRQIQARRAAVYGASSWRDLRLFLTTGSGRRIGVR